MDELQDPTPHPHIVADPHAADPMGKHTREELSIWFFCGILTLGYGIVLTGQGIYEHFGHQPSTVLAELQPTLWWGIALLLFGAFYTLKFRPKKR